MLNSDTINDAASTTPGYQERHLACAIWKQPFAGIQQAGEELDLSTVTPVWRVHTREPFITTGESIGVQLIKSQSISSCLKVWATANITKESKTEDRKVKHIVPRSVSESTETESLQLLHRAYYNYHLMQAAGERRREAGRMDQHNYFAIAPFSQKPLRTLLSETLDFHHFRTGRHQMIESFFNSTKGFAVASDIDKDHLDVLHRSSFLIHTYLRSVSTLLSDAVIDVANTFDIESACDNRVRQLLAQGQLREARLIVAWAAARNPYSTLLKYWTDMMKPTPVRLTGSATGRSRRLESAWLRLHGREHKGEWVALIDNHLVCADPNLAVVTRAIRQSGDAANTLIHFIPKDITPDTR